MMITHCSPCTFRFSSFRLLLEAAVILLHSTVNLLFPWLCSLLLQGYFIPVKFFSVKCVRLFVATKHEFPKICRCLQKISVVFERLAKTAEDFRWLLKIAKYFRWLLKITKVVERFLTISKQGVPMISKGIFSTNLQTLLKSSEDVATTSQMFLSNYTHYCHLL